MVAGNSPTESDLRGERREVVLPVWIEHTTSLTKGVLYH